MIKKIILTLLLLFSVLNANDNLTLKLYEKVLTSIFHSQSIKVFVDSDTREILQQSNRFEIVDTCDKSVVVLVGKFSKLSEICKDKPLFSTDYRSFKHTPNSFGAYYWRKGRPQLTFKRRTLEKYHLSLPLALEKYVYE